jgi:hypothetical protein
MNRVGNPNAGDGSSPVAMPPKPRRLKSIALTFCVVFPTIELLTRVVVPAVPPMHPIARDAFVVGSVCVLLSFVMPPLQARLRGWLLR